MKRLLKNFQIEISGTSYNSEYPATLRSAQIGFLWSPTSGTRGTLFAICPALKDRRCARGNMQKTTKCRKRLGAEYKNEIGLRPIEISARRVQMIFSDKIFV